MNRSYLPLVLIAAFFIGINIGGPLGSLVGMSCNKPSGYAFEGHTCKWDKCPYKGIHVRDWDKAVTGYVGEDSRMTDAWCIDMLHLEFPKDEYDKLEERLFNDMADLDLEGIKVISWDKDEDGLITASWEYLDGRVSGTDWTDRENIPKLIEETRSWPECADSVCHWVRPPTQDKGWEGKCWRHFPILEAEEEPKQELILIDAEDILRKL